MSAYQNNNYQEEILPDYEVYGELAADEVAEEMMLVPAVETTAAMLLVPAVADDEALASAVAVDDNDATNNDDAANDADMTQSMPPPASPVAVPVYHTDFHEADSFTTPSAAKRLHSDMEESEPQAPRRPVMRRRCSSSFGDEHDDDGDNMHRLPEWLSAAATESKEEPDDDGEAAMDNDGMGWRGPLGWRGDCQPAPSIAPPVSVFAGVGCDRCAWMSCELKETRTMLQTRVKNLEETNDRILDEIGADVTKLSTMLATIQARLKKTAKCSSRLKDEDRNND